MQIYTNRLDLCEIKMKDTTTKKKKKKIRRCKLEARDVDLFDQILLDFIDLTRLITHCIIL